MGLAALRRTTGGERVSRDGSVPACSLAIALLIACGSGVARAQGAGGADAVLEARAIEARARAADAAAQPGGRVRRFFVRGLDGIGGQESTGLVGAAPTIELGSHPFLGTLGIGLSLDALGAPNGLVTLAGGLFLQLDVVHAVYELFSILGDPPFGIDAGARLGLAYGRSDRHVPWAHDGFTFELMRPEWRFFVDVKIPLGRDYDGDARVLTVRVLSLDTDVAGSSVSRWSVGAGIAVEWDTDVPESTWRQSVREEPEAGAGPEPPS